MVEGVALRLERWAQDARFWAQKMAMSGYRCEYELMLYLASATTEQVTDLGGPLIDWPRA